MKLIFNLVLVIIGNISFSQTNNEITLIINNGFFKENVLVGTSASFEDYGPNSSVNLENTINSGCAIQFQKSFKKNRYFFVGSYEENLIRYKTIVFHPKFGLSDQFNTSDKLIFKNSSVTLGLGVFRRFAFFKEKLEWDVGFQFKHRHFRDSEIIKSKNENPDFLEQESGDLEYEVKVDFYSLNQRYILNPFSSLSYKLTPRLSCLLSVSLISPMVVSFEPRVSGFAKFESGPIFGSWAGQNFGKFDVLTGSISLGMGIKCKIGK